MNEDILSLKSVDDTELYHHIDMMTSLLGVLYNKLGDRILSSDKSIFISDKSDKILIPNVNDNTSDCIWKPVIHDDYYYISNQGHIRNKDGLLNSHITSKGYARIQLRNHKNYFIHRLVMEAFNPCADISMQINHINGVKHDNRVVNLEWVSASQNLLHAYNMGLKTGNSKYSVHCLEYNITTIGVPKMVYALHCMGIYVSPSGICRAMFSDSNNHMGLHFTGELLLELRQPSTIDNMTLIDLIELLCEWYVDSICVNNSNLSLSMEKFKEMYGINDQLIRIFENTAKEFGE